MTAPVSLSGPDGILIDTSGNLYVGDKDQNYIYKITPDGFATVLVGLDSKISTKAKDSAYSLDSPAGIALDASGTLYVADTSNEFIRKISPKGVVTTLAGSGKTGFSNGKGKTASFFFPWGIAVDSSDNVFVADSVNNTIRKITPEGTVSTLAGSAGVTGATNGPGSTARFFWPYGLAADNHGNLFVADTYNNLIRKIDNHGTVTTLAGSGFKLSNDGKGTEASFNHPYGLAVDGQGNVFVADTDNNLIREISQTGVVTTIAGSGFQGANDGNGKTASFHKPHGIAINRFGILYITDSDNHLIREIRQKDNL